MAASVFLSYARNDDEPFVERLAEALGSRRFNVWFDRQSMPSRQLTFHQEIRDAISMCDRLVLVVGPEAVSSSYVAQEWRFAYFEAGKVVNPIVRLDGQDANGKAIDAYELIPEDLRLIHAEDFRDDNDFGRHVDNLERQLSEPLPPVGKLIAVPELPPHFLERRERVESLRDMVLADLRKPVVVSGAAGRIGVQGMGGIGKSVLASALAHHPETRRAFPDGIYWVPLGQQPDLPALQRKLVSDLGGSEDFTDASVGKERLRELLEDLAAMVVLDDVWQREDAEAFNAIGPRSRILLTTRDAGLVTALAAKENHYQVQLPTDQEARAMLASAASVETHALPDEAAAVIGQCDRLPLALALCGGMVQAGTPWSDLLEALQEHDLEFLADEHPGEEQHANVWRTINVSVQALSEEDRMRYAELAVFPLDEGTPEAAVETLWGHTAGLSPRRARRLMNQLVARSLAQRPTEGQIELHDLLHNFATSMAVKRTGSIAPLHSKIVEAYRATCPQGWPTGPNDGYFLENIVRHLLEADRSEEAVELLDGLQWIEAKAKVSLVFSLQDEYQSTIATMPEAQEERKAEEEEKARAARWIETLIECAWEGRPPTPEEIPPSISLPDDGNEDGDKPDTPYARLSACASFVRGERHNLTLYGEREGLVVQQAWNSARSGPLARAAEERINQGVSAPMLLTPPKARPAYTPKPTLVRTLADHQRKVSSVDMTPDGRLAISGSWDKTVKVWDVASGRCLRTLTGHDDWVKTVCLTPDGRLAISGGLDHTLRVWDVEDGRCLHTLTGHESSVNCVALSADGRIAVSGSGPVNPPWERESTLKLWDFNSGTCFQTLTGFSSGVVSVALSLDGKRIVAGAKDGTVVVWEPASRNSIRTLPHTTGSPEQLVLDAYGDKLLILRDHCSVQCWDLGEIKRLWFRSYRDTFYFAFTSTADSRLAISPGLNKSVCVESFEQSADARFFYGHGDLVTDITATASGSTVLSASSDKSLKVWNSIGQVANDVHRHLSWVSYISFAEGKGIAASIDGSTIVLWDVNTGTYVKSLTSVLTDAVEIFSNGTRLISNNRVCLSFIDLPEGKTASELPERCTDFALCSRGEKIVTRHLNGGKLKIWDVRTREHLHTFDGDEIAVIADGSVVAGATTSNEIRLWNIEAGVCIQTLRGHTKLIRYMTSPRSSNVLFSSGLDRQLKVWSTDSGQCLQTFSEDDGDVRHASVSTDGRRVLFDVHHRILKVWDLDFGGCVLTMDWHPGLHAGDTYALTADGRFAVVGSGDKTIRVWDVDSRRCSVLIPLEAWPTALEVTPSNRIIAGLSDGRVLFLDQLNAGDLTSH